MINNLKGMKMAKIKISTKTIIAVSNIECDIEKIYENLPVLELDEENQKKFTIPIKKKRGRRRKNQIVSEQNENPIVMPIINTGDIVAIYYQNKQKGLPQYFKYNQKYFRNALNVIMLLENQKKINFKLSKNGKIQMTGCKDDNDAKLCLQFFFEKIFRYCKNFIIYRSEPFFVYYYTVMTNLDFNIGFEINRQKLNQIVNSSTEFNSLLETSFGYTGVNIKLPFDFDETILIDKMTFDNEWNHSQIQFQEFLTYMGPVFEKHEKNKKKYNTFLVFHSGNIIMSGMRIDKMMDHQHFFYNFLIKHRSDFEEIIH